MITNSMVLILVVMEEGRRRPSKWNIMGYLQCVLILVVMEEGRRQKIKTITNNKGKSLNPCCNGRGSKTRTREVFQREQRGLNPCCNGRGSKTLM